MTISRMDHFTIVTDRLAETAEFYAVLGLVAGPRPDFGFGGAWLYASERPILHLIEGTAPAVARGALDHMAFAGDSLVAVAAGLRARGVAWRLIRTPRPFSRWQLFFADPNGVDVEVDFDIAEEPPVDWKDHR